MTSLLYNQLYSKINYEENRYNRRRLTIFTTKSVNFRHFDKNFITPNSTHVLKICIILLKCITVGNSL